MEIEITKFNNKDLASLLNTLCKINIQRKSDIAEEDGIGTYQDCINMHRITFNAYKFVLLSVCKSLQYQVKSNIDMESLYRFSNLPSLLISKEIYPRKQGIILRSMEIQDHMKEIITSCLNFLIPELDSESIKILLSNEQIEENDTLEGFIEFAKMPITGLLKGDNNE